MDLEQGTAEALQDALETPQVDETISQEELTDEQKEEAAIAEEVKKHVNDDDPKGFQDRINKLVRQYRTEERARKHAEKEGTETKAVLEEMRKHNEKLYQAIQRQTNAIETSVDIQTEKKQKDADTQEINIIQQNIAYLKNERIKARQDMDFERESSIDDKLDELKEKLINKRNEAKQQKPKADANERYERSVVGRWANDTPWFSEVVDDDVNPDYDPKMERAARVYDKVLVDSGKWKDIPIEKRLEEVRKHIEEKYDYKPKQKGITKVPPVESGKNLPPPKKDNELTLSEEQKRAAYNTMPHLPKAEAEKKYAEQLKFIDGGR